MDSKNQRIGKHWSSVAEARRRASKKIRFWQFPTILQHVNRRICGKPLAGHSAGLVERVVKRYPGRIYERGISIGGGSGAKEMALLERGLVGHFVVYDLAEQRVRVGRDLAAKRGLQDRIEFRCEDGFGENRDDRYDFVHWNASLHHMFDVHAALDWSRRVLNNQGLLFLHEYVGPNRMQYSDDVLRLASSYRALLPDRYLRKNATKRYSVIVRPPNLERLIEADPSECADSENIMPALKRVFPGAKVFWLGGVVYFLALNDILANFDEGDETDLAILKLLLNADNLLSEAGYNLRAAALAFKE